MAALAAERPVLLVLDDLQWADDDTLLLLRHLLRRAGSAPVLVVAVSRDHDLDPGSALADVVHALDRDGWVDRVPLRGLDERDVGVLLAHLLGAGDHRDAARRMVAETAGNPFLVTELGHASAAGAPPGGIPQGVQDLVTSRLARLDDAVVDLLQAGAVAGATFDLDVGAAVAGLDDDATLDAADAALRTGLVVEEGSDRFRFAHDIVRRTLEARVSGVRRRALHRRTADEIERLRARDLDGHVAVLAHHATAGAEPGGDERAVRWSRRASDQAAARRAPAEAVRLCRQALDHVPPDRGALLAEVTTELGIALLSAGDHTGAATLADGAAWRSGTGSPTCSGGPPWPSRTRPTSNRHTGPRPASSSDVALAAGPPDVGTERERIGTRASDGAVLRARLVVRRLRLGAGPTRGGNGAGDGNGDSGRADGGGIEVDAAPLVGGLHRRIVELAGPEHLDAPPSPRRRARPCSPRPWATSEPPRSPPTTRPWRRRRPGTRRSSTRPSPSSSRPPPATTPSPPPCWPSARWRPSPSRAASTTPAPRSAVVVDGVRAADGELPDDDEARSLLDPPDVVVARHRAVLDWLAGTDPPGAVLVGATTEDLSSGGAARLHELAAGRHRGGGRRSAGRRGRGAGGSGALRRADLWRRLPQLRRAAPASTSAGSPPPPATGRTPSATCRRPCATTRACAPDRGWRSPSGRSPRCSRPGAGPPTATGSPGCGPRPTT